MRIRTAAVAVLAAAALAAGCSSTSDKPDAKPTSAAPAAAPADAPSATAGSDDKAALTAAVNAYTAAFFKPDAAATFDLLSKRCAADTSVTEMRQVLDASAAMYGKPVVKSVEVTQLSGPLARATVHYVRPPVKETPQSWVSEGGRWKYDGC